VVTLQVNGTCGLEEGPLHIKYDGGIPAYADLLSTCIPALRTPCQKLAGQLGLDSVLRIWHLSTCGQRNKPNSELHCGGRLLSNHQLDTEPSRLEIRTSTLIYSLDSDVLIYESWVPIPYGDVIVQELTARALSLKSQVRNCTCHQASRR
jgi:hypothetical protein